MVKKSKNDELVRKALLLGLGAASCTAEVIDEAARKLMATGDISEAEARGLVKQFASSQGKSLRQAVRKQLAYLDEKSPFASKRELDALDARVKKLEVGLKKHKH